MALKKIAEATLQDFTITNESCREGNKTRWGGGGGVSIFARESLPCLHGKEQVPYPEKSLGRRSAKLSRSNSPEQAIAAEEDYRPADGTAAGRVLQENEK